MKKRRQYRRFDFKEEVLGFFKLKTDISGHFRNYEKFLLINISLGGFKLLSNYSPAIGSVYTIFVEYEDNKFEFEIEVMHASITNFTEEYEKFFKPGTIFNIGCKIISMEDDQKRFIVFLIQNKCEFVSPEFIEEKLTPDLED